MWARNLVPMLVEAGHAVVNVSRGQAKPYTPHEAWCARRDGDDRSAGLRRTAGTFGARIAALQARNRRRHDLLHAREHSSTLVEALRGRVGHFLLHCGPSGSTATTPRCRPSRTTAAQQPRRIRVRQIGRYRDLAARARPSRTGFPATVFRPGHIVGPGWEPLESGRALQSGRDVLATIKRGEELALSPISGSRRCTMCTPRTWRRWRQRRHRQSLGRHRPSVQRGPAGRPSNCVATPRRCTAGSDMSPEFKYLPFDEWKKNVDLTPRRPGSTSSAAPPTQSRKPATAGIRAQMVEASRGQGIRDLADRERKSRPRTAGNAYSEEEAQPFYVNAPFGIVLVHNGNLTNAHGAAARSCSPPTAATPTPTATPKCCSTCWRTSSRARSREAPLDPADRCSRRSAPVHKRLRGSYAVVALIAGHGLLAFRDPYGIRPLCYRRRRDGRRQRVMVASESVGASKARAMCSSATSRRARLCSSTWRATCTPSSAPTAPTLNPCMFEFVYLARPDSVMDGISVYQARLNLGETLAKRVVVDRAAERDRRDHPDPRVEPPERHAAGAPARHALPRRLREEPLRRPHLHHAGAGRAQEVGAPEAQRDRQSSSRAATCCWSTTPSCAAPPARRSCRWRATPAPARSTWPRPRRRCATPTSTASTCRPSDELIAHDRTIEEIREYIGCRRADLPGRRRA